MCIVIDINVLASVFDPSCKQHPEFSAVLTWIQNGNGFLIYGGTKYLEELSKTIRYLKIVRLLRDSGKAFRICDQTVDKIHKDVNKKTKGTKCDDQHIIALLAASKCDLLCSHDGRSFTFIKNRSLYPHGSAKVKIYTSSKNIKLLKPNCSISKLANVV